MSALVTDPPACGDTAEVRADQPPERERVVTQPRRIERILEREHLGGWPSRSGLSGRGANGEQHDQTYEVEGSHRWLFAAERGLYGIFRPDPLSADILRPI